MSDTDFNPSELAESLRICEEIQNTKLDADIDMPGGSLHLDTDNETFKDIDMILTQEGVGVKKVTSSSVMPEEVKPLADAIVVPKSDTESHVSSDKDPIPPVDTSPTESVTPPVDASPAESVTSHANASPTESVTPSVNASPYDDGGIVLQDDENVSYLESATMYGDAVENVAFGDVSVGVVSESVEYSEGHPFLRLVMNILICVAAALILSLIITRFVAHHTAVDGSSMESTLTNGDQLVVEEVSYYLHDPERFDIIVFPTKNHDSYIKRIIALPGETVQIKDGQVYVDGKMQPDSFGREQIDDPGLAAEPIVLKSDEYFVLGDNRNASVDSRFDDVGLIKKDDIAGKAWMRFYPFAEFGIIE